MKIRLVGPSDLIRKAAARFGAYGIHGKEYDSRYNANDLRWYADVDDREMERLVAAVAPTSADFVHVESRPVPTDAPRIAGKTKKLSKGRAT